MVMDAELGIWEGSDGAKAPSVSLLVSGLLSTVGPDALFSR